MRQTPCLAIAIVGLLCLDLCGVCPASAQTDDVAATPQDGDAAATSQADETEEGFAPLFNGESLEGWQGATDGYVAQDGVLVCLEKGGNLYTDKEYGDFHLKFEFKLTPGANNGLGVRTPLEGDPAYVGMELQILDNTAEQYENLKPWQYHGSVYGVVPAKRGHLKPAGEWNEQEVICRGPRVTVKLNGVVILDADVQKASDPKTVDGSEHPGLDREQGHLAFCGHGAHVEFRNLRLKELTDEGE
jgi:hypothetical protein